MEESGRKFDSLLFSSIYIHVWDNMGYNNIMYYIYLQMIDVFLLILNL